MAETSAIEWTDATVNFWWGCTKVGPGCDHCYAETLNAFRGNGVWGIGAPRRKIKGAHALLAKLNRTAWRETHGHRIRVFMSSMGDLFDNEVDPEWRMEAYHAAAAATNLDIQFLTKRVSNVEKMIPPSWHGNWPRHIGLMITVVNQAEADRDVPRLLALKEVHHIPWVGLSCEPLLGPIDLRFLQQPNQGGGPYWIDGLHPTKAGWYADESCTQITEDAFAHDGYGTLDWVIAGGESGPNARPTHPYWFHSLRDQCAETGTPFLFKQWGEWTSIYDRDQDDPDWRRIPKAGDWRRKRWLNLAGGQGFHGDKLNMMKRVGKKRAGRLLDGAEHNGFPKAFDRRPA